MILELCSEINKPGERRERDAMVELKNIFTAFPRLFNSSTFFYAFSTPMIVKIMTLPSAHHVSRWEIFYASSRYDEVSPFIVHPKRSEAFP
jgi:hypothetical protein